MEQKNNEQNSVIFSISEILNKMSNQVGFLIRNKKLLSQLDVDILMDNTRKLYDTICSVRCSMDVDSIPMEVENNEEPIINDDKSEVENEVIENQNEVCSFVPFTIENNDNDSDNVESEILIEDTAPNNDTNFEEDNKENDVDFDDEEDKEESAELDYKNIDFDDEEDKEESTELDYKNIDFDDEEVIGTITKPIGKETVATSSQQTIGDVLENAEDNSLAARLQRKAISDLTTAIGINDKFLLLNELFNGSMEKYNKCIRSLNNFTTLLGAKTYMDELQVEFQWDCQSDAYKKLNDLVERRFI